jgi:hypothetical protein
MDQYEWEKMAPLVRRKYLEILRSMPPGKRLKIAIEHSEYVRKLMLAGTRMRNPGISDECARRQLIRMILPPELLRKVYDWAKDEDSR